MYSLPNDLFLKIKSKYSNINEKEILNLINDIFDGILNKTFDDGSCTIRKFGSFSSYISFSKRKGKDLVKFKFVISKILNQQIRDDIIIKNKINKFVKRIFDNKKINEDLLQRRASNYEKLLLTINNKKFTNKLTKNNEIREMIRGLLGKQQSD